MRSEYPTILSAFDVLFSKRIWQHVQVLLIGAILAPGQRTVTAVLRIMGLSAEKHFQNFHRVLNRAVWSSREASRLLLEMLVSVFAMFGPIVMGLDDTIERRRGARIKAKGIYRDPVRSSHSHFVKASGLRWLDWAILRTTPALLALFSLVTLLANTHVKNGKIPIRQAAWYSKPLPTFSDTLALVRQELWQHRYFQLSQKQYDVQKLHPALLDYLQNAAFYTP